MQREWKPVVVGYLGRLMHWESLSEKHETPGNATHCIKFLCTGILKKKEDKTFNEIVNLIDMKS